MNKQELISKIKSLQDISSEEKAYLIELVNTKKKYGLVWEEKPEDVEEQLRSMLPVFKEVKERAIISENIDAPNHILIEGDNLHALTALSYTHEGKVDVIYIDPPYNTGNKDFIYNDAYVDKEDSYRHSKWLSFMDKRLRLGKKLLSEKGVIFISIDDNEQSQLKLLCDEVFGENNFVSQFLWEKTSTPPALSKKVRKKLEYVLCYEKSFDNISYSIGNVDGGDVPLLNSGNKHSTLRFPANSIKFNITDGIYSENGNRKVTLLNDIIVKDAVNLNEIELSGNFKWKQSMLDEEISKGTYFIVKTDLFSIRFQRDENNLKTKTPTNIINKENNVGTNEEGKKELENIKIDYFDYPKPVSLIKLLTNLKYNKESIVLDFFAGSGTTLHATMALNAEDGGNRQCILVTNNENKIAEEVTYERNKRVIQGYTNAKGEQVEGLVNNNLRYFQADFVPSERTEINRRLLTARSTELLCIKEDCFLDVTKDYNIKERQAKLFTNGLGKYMIVIYHSRNQEEVIAQLTELIQNLETTEKIKLYAFSPEKESIEEDFFAVADKIAAVPLPDSIYNAYRATFRTLKLNNKPAAVNSLNQDI